MTTFGLTYEEVIVCFPGSELQDYDAGGAQGQANVELEIRTQSSRLMSILPRRVLAVLEGNVREILRVYDDETLAWFLTVGTPDAQGITIESWPKPLHINCHGGIPPATNTVEVTWNVSEERWEFDDYADYQFNLIYLALYKPNLDQVVSETLKSLLRDMVCCAIGKRLYSNQEDDWGQVRYHCEAAKDTIKMIRGDRNWLPPEWEGQFLLTNSIIKSHKVYRG